ncbi:MAG TPA: glutamate 5-kinase, partial [Polyangia bacterium]|nr:glutamate 5-kinase [Polyangia bacterium]
AADEPDPLVLVGKIHGVTARTGEGRSREERGAAAEERLMSAARRELAEAHRIVVKLGTHVVMREGAELARDRIDEIVASLADLRRAGRQVLLVSSGAVGMGMRVLGLTDRPRSLGLRQACAAVGQGHLMSVYTQAFAARGLTAAQVLLTQDDLADRDRALCLRTTLMRLLELGVVPVLNENDSVSVTELVEYRRAQAGGEPGAAPRVFGDNDGLAALVAVSLDADLLIMLTNVGGLFTANPKLDPSATLIAELEDIDSTTLARASGGSAGGTGGMASKLAAARLASSEGTAVLIAGGESGVLARALAGDAVGTLVSGTRRPARLRHIAVGARHRGALVVNDGALAALTGAKKASLLPIGVTGVEGTFDQGDVVEIRDGSGRVHGRGLVNYPSDACRKLAGRHSDDIDAILGWRGYDALITRDNLVMGAL